MPEDDYNPSAHPFLIGPAELATESLAGFSDCGSSVSSGDASPLILVKPADFPSHPSRLVTASSEALITQSSPFGSPPPPPPPTSRTGSSSSLSSGSFGDAPVERPYRSSSGGSSSDCTSSKSNVGISEASGDTREGSGSSGGTVSNRFHQPAPSSEPPHLTPSPAAGSGSRGSLPLLSLPGVQNRNWEELSLAVRNTIVGLVQQGPCSHFIKVRVIT